MQPLPTARSQSRIQSYALFGEAAAPPDRLPDVLHCETLAARSELHGWELTPHRHAGLHQILLVQRGRGTAQLESGSLPLRARSVVNIPAGDVHGFRFDPGIVGWVTTLPDELLAPWQAALGERLARAAVGRADAELMAIVRQIHAEFERSGPARALVLQGLAGALFGLTARALQLGAPDPEQAPPATRLVQQFEALVDRHHPQQWSVARYAQALAISPTHLSRVSRAVTGRSALRLIEERVMREARRQLAFTALPVKLISDELGFADPAYFSRAFQRAVGQSPRAFRRQVLLRVRG